MTAPWSQPQQYRSAPPGRHPATPGYPWWAPMAGWLLTMGALLIVISTTYARASAWAVIVGSDGGPRYIDGTGLINNVQIPLPLLTATVVLSFVGVVAATVVGLPAVPGARLGAVAVTVGLLGLVGVVGLAVYRDAADEAARPYSGGDDVYTETTTVFLVVCVLPAVILLLLVWLARRGAASTAAVFGVLGAAAHLVSLGLLVACPPHVARGSWLMLLAVLVSAGGSLLMAWTTPRRAGRAPALQPGDVGWTAS